MRGSDRAALLGELAQQGVGFAGPAEREHGAGQRHPGVIEGRARVRDGGPELVHGGGRLVREQPLLAGSHVGFGPAHAFRRSLDRERGLHGEAAHPDRGPFVVARPGSVDLDRVEQLTGKHNHVC